MRRELKILWQIKFEIPSWKKILQTDFVKFCYIFWQEFGLQASSIKIKVKQNTDCDKTQEERLQLTLRLR